MNHDELLNLFEQWLKICGNSDASYKAAMQDACWAVTTLAENPDLIARNGRLVEKS